jgi:hypothetical protein
MRNGAGGPIVAKIGRRMNKEEEEDDDDEMEGAYPEAQA